MRERGKAIGGARLRGRDGVIQPEDLNLPRQAAAESHRNVDEPDRDSIESALDAANGTVSRAARSLGLSRQALYRRMERFEARLTAQFTAMDQLVASLQSTGSYLTQQLSSLPGFTRTEAG